MSKRYPGTADFKGFAIVNIDKSVKAKVKKETLTPEQAAAFLIGLSEDGYKVSVRYSESNDAFQAMAYGAEPGMQNAGLGLAIWHADPYTAITALKVLHEEVYQGEWPTQNETNW